jgi:hypothetical protein
MNAMLNGVKNSFNFEEAGSSLHAYIINNPIDVKNAYLKMVPYYVTKKPSDPSLITSATSCIPLGPTSFFNISQRMQSDTHINTIDIINAEKDMIIDVELETNM